MFSDMDNIVDEFFNSPPFKPTPPEAPSEEVSTEDLIQALRPSTYRRVYYTKEEIIHRNAADRLTTLTQQLAKKDRHIKYLEGIFDKLYLLVELPLQLQALQE